MYIGLNVKYPVFLSDFSEIWICLTYFWQILKYKISWKSVQWELSCSMRTNKHDKTNSRFSQLCERAYKQITFHWTTHDTNKLPQYMCLTAKGDFYNNLTQYCQSQWHHNLQHKLSLTTRPLVPRNNTLLNRQQNADHANLITIIITTTTIFIHTPTSSIIFCLFRAAYKKSSSSHNLSLSITIT
jgi:uncharacterized protein YozE (UPF0346 family)